MSLIEVMMAGTLLAVGAAGVISGWSTVMGILEHQRRLNEATSVVRTHVELLLALPAGDPALAGGTTPAGTFDIFNRAVAAGNTGYAVVYDIVEDRPGPGFIQLTTRAEWSERGQPRSTVLTTFRER